MTFQEAIPLLLDGAYLRLRKDSTFQVIKLNAPGPEGSISYAYSEDGIPGNIRYWELGFRVTREKLETKDWEAVGISGVPGFDL